MKRMLSLAVAACIGIFAAGCGADKTESEKKSKDDSTAPGVNAKTDSAEEVSGDDAFPIPKTDKTDKTVAPAKTDETSKVDDLPPLKDDPLSLDDDPFGIGADFDATLKEDKDAPKKPSSSPPDLNPPE